MSVFALRFNKLFSVQKCFHSYQLQYILPISTTSSSLQEHSPYVIKRNETFEIKKARLLYQSRKRGMLENDLLLSTFAEKFLNTFTTNQLELYDKLINLPSNDWDIYYWATGVKETPLEFQNEIMELFKKHVSNKNCETRFRQPDINS